MNYAIFCMHLIDLVSECRIPKNKEAYKNSRKKINHNNSVFKHIKIFNKAIETQFL